MSFWKLDKIPEHKKSADNFVYKITDEYSLTQQNEILKIITTRIIKQRRIIIQENTEAKVNLEKILNKL